jgi:hypothetical protein
MTNLYDNDSREKIELGAKELRTCLQARDHPTDTELVIGICWDPQDEVFAIGYYLASMTCQAVFWLDEFDPTLVTQNDRIVVSEAHLGQYIHDCCRNSNEHHLIGFAVTAQFWYVPHM